MQWCHCWWCWNYVMLETVVSHDQKRHAAYYLNCLYLWKTAMLFMILLATCNTATDTNSIMWHQHHWHHSHVTSNFDCLYPKNVMVTWRILVASCEPTSVPMAWHGKKSHVATHFYHLHLWNAIMPWTSSNTDTHTKALHDQRSYVAPHLDHLHTRKIMVLLTMPSASCDAGANVVTFCTSFW